MIEPIVAALKLKGNTILNVQLFKMKKISGAVMDTCNI